MSEDIKLMKGNEAIAHAAIRYGVDGYFGYPITPQSEILETLMAEMPWEKTGMVVLQAESEVAAINMVYGGAGTGKRVMTSSSSPGVSLKQEGISYMAGAELPCLIVNVMRGGPGLGTIQPSQADYFQTVKGGGHGDYRLITLAPSSVQEMADFVGLGFELAFKYRNPAIILADGIIGQMMEKVVLPPYQPRRTEEEVVAQCPWAAQGKKASRRPNVITSLELDPAKMEENNLRFQEKYRKIQENEVRYEEIMCDDAEYLLVAFGSSARICQKVVEIARHDEQRHIRADTGRDVLQIADEPFKDIHGPRDPDIARPLGTVEPEPRPLPARKQHGGKFSRADRRDARRVKLRPAGFDLTKGKPGNGRDRAARTVCADMGKRHVVPVDLLHLAGKFFPSRLADLIPPTQDVLLPVRRKERLQLLKLHILLLSKRKFTKTRSAYRLRRGSPMHSTG